MERGSYNGRRVNFEKYAVTAFTPYLFSDAIRSRIGCGASALATITGILPEVIAGQNKNKAHYSDEFMLRFLRRRRFSALPLTQCRISEGHSNLGDAHVILLSQLLGKNFASWGLIHRRMYFHNFDVYQLERLSFINKPIISAYLVFHPKWCFDDYPKEELKQKIRPNDPSFTLENLYGPRAGKRVTPKKQEALLINRSRA
ncbi:MAG: hypothetical protein ABSH48_27245 [Verrucomicrobiota bacterium]